MGFSLSDNEDEGIRIQNQTMVREELKQLHNDIEYFNEYKFEPCDIINVLMVGKSRSGKSTSIRVLQDPTYIPKPMSIFSDIVEPHFTSFCLEIKERSGYDDDDDDNDDDNNNNFDNNDDDDNDNDNNNNFDNNGDNGIKKIAKKYMLNIIDTPGLKEVTRRGSNARSDKVILNSISYCLRNEITKINVLLIFVSFELGVSNDDIESIKQYLLLFNDSQITIGFCISRSEHKTQKKRDQLVEELYQHPYFGSLFESNKNIFISFLGCVDSELIENSNSINDLRKVYTNVYYMRKALLEALFQTSSKSTAIIDLPISKLLVNEIREIIDHQFHIIHRLTSFYKNGGDHDDDEDKDKDYRNKKRVNIDQLFDEFQLNTQSLYKYEGLLSDRFISPLILQLQNSVKSLLPHIPKYYEAKLRSGMNIE